MLSPAAAPVCVCLVSGMACFSSATLWAHSICSCAMQMHRHAIRRRRASVLTCISLVSGMAWHALVQLDARGLVSGITCVSSAATSGLVSAMTCFSSAATSGLVSRITYVSSAATSGLVSGLGSRR